MHSLKGGEVATLENLQAVRVIGLLQKHTDGITSLVIGSQVQLWPLASQVLANTNRRCQQEAVSMVYNSPAYVARAHFPATLGHYSL